MSVFDQNGMLLDSVSHLFEEDTSCASQLNRPSSSLVLLLFANHNEGDITRSASTSKTSSTACGTPSDGRSYESLEVIEQMTYLMCIRVLDDALSPRTLAELCKLVESLGTPPLFVEPQYEDMATRTISRETGAALFAPDPIVTVPADAPLTYYEDMMRQNAAVPAGALGE